MFKLAHNVYDQLRVFSKYLVDNQTCNRVPVCLKCLEIEDPKSDINRKCVKVI